MFPLLLILHVYFFSQNVKHLFENPPQKELYNSGYLDNKESVFQGHWGIDAAFVLADPLKQHISAELFFFLYIRN